MTKRMFAATALVALVAAGCSIGNTTASEVALQYGAGPFDSRKFVACVPVNTRSVDDVNDDHYYYPAGQRDFNFNPDQAADSAVITSATKDPTEITVSGTVKFTINTDCSPFKDANGKEWPGGKIQMFHELIASKYDAAPTDGGEPMKGGWRDLLRAYIGAAVDRAVDNEALKYGYLELFTDEAKKAAWERDVLKQIPEILRTLTQGQDLITVNAVILQKPNVAPQILAGFADQQAAKLRAQAVEIDKAAASSFPGGLPAYQAYQQQQAINQAIKEGKVQVLPVPQGSSIIVSPK